MSQVQSRMRQVFKTNQIRHKMNCIIRWCPKSTRRVSKGALIRHPFGKGMFYRHPVLTDTTRYANDTHRHAHSAEKQKTKEKKKRIMTNVVGLEDNFNISKITSITFTCNASMLSTRLLVLLGEKSRLKSNVVNLCKHVRTPHSLLVRVEKNMRTK